MRPVGQRFAVLWGFSALIALWYVLALIIQAPIFPTPYAIVKEMVVMTYQTPFVRSSIGTNSVVPHLIATMGRTILGVLAGTAAAVVVGLILGRQRNLRAFFESPIEVLRTIPPLAYLPFFSLWFGPTNTAIFLLVFANAFFMMVVNTMNAIKNVDPMYSLYAKTMGASDSYIYRTVVMPAIVPELTGGIRVVIVYSWGITIAGELLGAKRGVGQVLMSLTTFSAVKEILGTTIWVGLLAILLDKLYVRLNRGLVRWKE